MVVVVVYTNLLCSYRVRLHNCRKTAVSSMPGGLFSVNITAPELKRVCVQPRPLAVDMTLPAFAAERCPVLPQSGCQSCCSAAVTGQTDGRTDGRTLHRYTDLVPPTVRAMPLDSLN